MSRPVWPHAAIAVPAFVTLTVLWSTHAYGLTPPINDRREALAGTWVGSGDGVTFCVLRLDSDGRGVALVDSGSDRWRAVLFHWSVSARRLDVRATSPIALSVAASANLSTQMVRTVDRKLPVLGEISIDEPTPSGMVLRWRAAPAGSCALVPEGDRIRQRQLSQHLLDALDATTKEQGR